MATGYSFLVDDTIVLVDNEDVTVDSAFVSDYVRIWKNYIGRPVALKVRYSDGTSYTDPDEVTLKVRAPSGALTTYTYSDDDITRFAAGGYWMDVTPDQEGRWHYRWESSGTAATTYATEGTFNVQASRFYNSPVSGDYA